MTSAVIVSTARTPLAKSWRGSFNLTHGATLGGHVVQHAIQRAGIDPAEVEDVIMGCALPEGATGANIARQIVIRAGLPDSVTSRAKQVLKVLEKTAPNADTVTQLDFGTIEKFAQTPVPSELVEKLQALDLETLTPIEALNFLYELKKTLADG